MKTFITYFLLVLLAPSIYAQVRRVNTKANNFVEYNFIDQEHYTLKWGNKKIVRSLSDTIYSHYGCAKVEWENPYAIVLKDGCGSSCWYALILPLNDTTEFMRRNYPFAMDGKRSLIAYGDDEAPASEDSALTIEDFITHQKKSFYAKDCHLVGIEPAWCISKVEFKGDSLYYEWSGAQNFDSRRTVYLGFPR